MEYTVKIHKKNKTVELKAEKGANLLKFLSEQAVEIKSPCGGKGICGKCRILTKGLPEKILPKEKQLLGEKAVLKGFRLACYNKINSDIEVFLDDGMEEASIITEGRKREIKLNPVIKKEYAELCTPDIHNQQSDLDRITNDIEKLKVSNSIELLRELPEIIRLENFKVTLVTMDKKLVSVEPGDTTRKLYGMAIDIGTTTIAAYLIDLLSGKNVDVYPMLNPQKKFGADVISRIEYASTSKDCLSEINSVITGCINDVIEQLAIRNNIEKTDIYSVVFVGNTTMIHLLLKIPPKNIGVSPFIAGTTQLHKFKAEDLGININPFGYAVVFPGVSGYIGADTVAAVISSGMFKSEKISLMIDIGTNGEMVLGNSKWMISCSTAAGPAFEGANIRNGVGGIKGAIDKVTFNPDFEYTTIGNEKAIGICGSGIVDAIAGMLEKGIVDETGRIISFNEAEELKLCELSDRFENIDGKNSFVLLKSDECNSDIDIAITQKDVRELQNAKAAIAAGIRTLVNIGQINMKDIDVVYLAGGFGSYINKDSAVKIGLLPKELKGKIESIGNAAGSGAIAGLISVKILREAEKIKNKIKYVELSACPEFMDEYIECMMFE